MTPGEIERTLELPEMAVGAERTDWPPPLALPAGPEPPIHRCVHSNPQCTQMFSYSLISTAPAGRPASIALLAGAVADHGEVLAFRAHVAGIALHDCPAAALGGE